MAKKTGFTLVELLMVVSILTVLMTISLPMIRSIKSASGGYSATRGLQQFYTATTLYLADSDDVYMIAFAPADDGLTSWFGHRSNDGSVDKERGVLSYYLGKHRPKDPTHQALPKLGDGSGYGYNWGYLGSDMHVTGRYEEFPECVPAAVMQVSDPSTTVLFGTSAEFSAPWKGGDGLTYDYGFIDPPFDWKGVPTVDFRHHGTRVVDPNARTAIGSGQALFLFCDGSVRAYRAHQVTDAMFQRMPDEGAEPVALGNLE